MRRRGGGGGGGGGGTPQPGLRELGWERTSTGSDGRPGGLSSGRGLEIVYTHSQMHCICILGWSRGVCIGFEGILGNSGKS